ncbi:Mrp/NBP35 family ATP-binding protein [Rubrimonas cliftonensis]|uniref:Iron-sulfur cluster carrier protein n=1 Tax=Rubrimonas cliftonensis TaxID=89524 RepID=A0A1H3W8M7_9RHOB|nr:Mrp/NBP35 family ATP-binding protein [Rubrimonas cliftonensis]SDZ82638.1 ATP-binding protein involved in chromosome partitioning [Rubrimonas cliftonensis]
MSTTREAVLSALDAVPVRMADTGGEITAAKLVQGLSVSQGAVAFAIEVDPRQAAAMEPVRAAAEAAVRALPGVSRVSAVLTAHSDAPARRSSQPQPSQPVPPSLRAGPGDKPLRAPSPAPSGGRIPGVRHIVAVASGKGGVGKSTVAANLALALKSQGARVGVLDADVYGPSQPRMLGVTGRPESDAEKMILPLHGHGLTVMSMGFMIEEGQSVVWRGPMLISALTQMLHQVRWGTLDYLVVDLPPGTGDVQLTLSQKAAVSGAVVVSTPQDIALLDARKALDMFRKTGTPVLGLIENMSTYICPNCAHEAHIFGHGGARDEAARLGLPFLGELPLDLDTRMLSDSGAPIVASRPGSDQARRFLEIAARLVEAPQLAGG